MNTSASIENIALFKSVFKGREDVFAIRWEKDGKTGYTPAYHYDPYWYRLHKMKGGSFQNFNEKSYLPLTDEQLLKHLSGDQLSKFRVINEHLMLIRNKGRQAFLENSPENFSRIMHDYSDDKKGFVIWKDILEERLA